jgi:hypothetical protein
MNSRIAILKYAEYPAVSISRMLLPEHRRRHRPQINVITASRAGSQSEALFTRTF